MVEYVPIACIEHERLEFAVLKRQRLNLVWLDGNGIEHAQVVLPTDVFTRDAAEWLDFRLADGQAQRIRLDQIRSLQTATALEALITG